MLSSGLELVQATAQPSNAPRDVRVVRTRTDPWFYFVYDELDDDMRRMANQLVVEPTLTRAWGEVTHECCRQAKRTVIDVGGNYGWYTLYSLALGCTVTVFEPVPAFLELLRIGLILNYGFAERVTIYRNVVSDQPGEYNLSVPIPQYRGFPYLKKLGMTGLLSGPGAPHGLIKGYEPSKFRTYTVSARAVQIDNVLESLSPKVGVCMLKVSERRCSQCGGAPSLEPSRSAFAWAGGRRGVRGTRAGDSLASDAGAVRARSTDRADRDGHPGSA